MVEVVHRMRLIRDPDQTDRVMGRCLIRPLRKGRWHRILMGVRVDKLFVQLCVISNPHDHLNEPQTGLYHETRGNDFFTPHISQYLSTGSLGQGQTCTLTRLK